MKITKNFGLNMPDEDDFVEIDKINENAEKIDEELAKKADASGGDISETVITTVKASRLSIQYLQQVTAPRRSWGRSRSFLRISGTG